jgi:hypothetical protein
MMVVGCNQGTRDLIQLIVIESIKMIIDFQKLPSITLENLRDKITTNKGLYAFFDNISDEVVYIGAAAGELGLNHRIIKQHMNTRYLESKETKQSLIKDQFQWSCPIIKQAKDGTEKKWIDKSALRKSVGRELCLKPGEETVNYIKKNLYLKVFELRGKKTLDALEKSLIEEYNPRFNVKHRTNLVK